MRFDFGNGCNFHRFISSLPMIKRSPLLIPIARMNTGRFLAQPNKTPESDYQGQTGFLNQLPAPRVFSEVFCFEFLNLVQIVVGSRSCDQ
jgi:hypothetical protein